MNVQSTTLGGLACQTVDNLPAGSGPKLLVVLCHGFGAPGTDLVPLGAELIRMKPELANDVRFIFPAAPLSMEEMGMSGARAWWHLDVTKLAIATETGQFRDLRNDNPDGLSDSRDMLLNLIGELQKQTGLPMSRIVLGGFSQGSMLATDVMLRLPEKPAGLCVFSGTLLNESEWRELAPKRGNLPVLPSHGHQDPILPYQAAEWLRDLLQESGLSVEFLPFNGVHSIPPEAMQRFAEMLANAEK